MNDIIKSNLETMTSLQIAEVTGKMHKDVLPLEIWSQHG